MIPMKNDIRYVLRFDNYDKRMTHYNKDRVKDP